VPARLASERLPMKPLQDLCGAPLIVRTFQNLAPLVAAGARVVVATDAAAVVEACAAHGIPAEMTRIDHQSGTDRCHEVAARNPGYPFVMNVQGDEPFADVRDLETLAREMAAKPDADMGTLVHEASDPATARDPNAVKAVRAATGWALYFSRAAIPYDREARERSHVPAKFWHHMGVYAFRRDRLAEFVRLGPSLLERTEKLEQLRALEAGWRIHLAVARTLTRGVDTPADLEAARALYQGQRSR
jgi:3-deoxy-manno-octulosonate cytidylyltransferase (CMP-KDO synthetase)